MKVGLFGTRWLFVGALALFTAAGTGCSSPAPMEAKGTSTAKLMAPRAMIRTKSSAQTKAMFGITEWRIYRGKRDVFMTGYDASGKAVKGLSVGFLRGPDGGEPQLRTRIHDGTRTSGRHGLKTGRTRLNRVMSSSSDAFVTQALADAGKIRVLFRAKKTAQPAAQCGEDLANIVKRAIECVNKGGTQAMCMAVAQAAASSTASCKNVGTVGSSKGKAGSSSGSSSGGSKAGGTKKAGSSGSGSKAGSKQSDQGSADGTSKDSADEDLDDELDDLEDDLDMEDELDNFEDDFEDDLYEEEPDYPFDDESCASCDEGADDIYGDVDTGEVGYEDDWGNDGTDYGDEGYDDYSDEGYDGYEGTDYGDEGGGDYGDEGGYEE